MKWIKASERLPEKREIYHVKQYHKSHGVEYGLYPATRLYDPIEGWSHGFDGEDLWYIVDVWLDESPQPNKAEKEIFHHMQEFPERENEETFSKTVLLFDEDGEYVDLGYYDFKDNKWHIFGDMSMKIICWYYPPVATEFLKQNNLVSVKHFGYC